MDDLAKQPDLIRVFSIFGRKQFQNETGRKQLQNATERPHTVFWFETNKKIVPLNPKKFEKQPMALKNIRLRMKKEVLKRMYQGSS